MKSKQSKITNAIGVTLFESDGFGGWKFPQDGLAPTLRANKVCAGIVEVREVDMSNGENTIAKSRAEQSRAA